MLFRQRSVFFWAAISLIPTPAGAQNRARIVDPVNESVRVSLRGSRHPLARPEFAGGRVDPDLPLDRMLLMLDAGPDVESGKRAFLERLHTSGSPDFHQWKTPEEFGRRFGPLPRTFRRCAPGWSSRW